MNFKVIEKFKSINGEGIRSGELTTFIRFKGCNLRCKYCDSAYSFADKEPYEEMTELDIVEYLTASGTKNVTLAGGEPLFQKDIENLVRLLCAHGFSVEIETNGSIDIKNLASIEKNRPYLTLDYKCGCSGMEHANRLENYKYLTKQDSVKFVVGSEEDLKTAVNIVKCFDLLKKANVLLSPCFGWIEPVEIVEFMKKYNLNGYKLQMQIHKFIWSPNERGV